MEASPDYRRVSGKEHRTDDEACADAGDQAAHRNAERRVVTQTSTLDRGVVRSAHDQLHQRAEGDGRQERHVGARPREGPEFEG